MMLSHYPVDHALKRALNGTNGQTVSVFGQFRRPPLYLFLARCVATSVA
jgi:hypothetical protein